jgi:hypothetical protein
VFHDSAWVRVNAGAGDCLNARNSPSKNEEYAIVNVCLPDGYEGLISGAVNEADGHFWWYLAGLGYVAEEYLTYVGEFDARANRIPELTGNGRIAFLRGNDIWTMDADGGRQTLVRDLPDSDYEAGIYEPYPDALAWSPDGTMLSYNMHRPGNETTTIDLHVLSLADGSERVFAGAVGGGWSADSQRIGVIREPSQAQMSSGHIGVPAVLDLTTGGQLVLAGEPFFQDEAPAFNHDGTLLMVSYGRWDESSGVKERAIIVYDNDGVEAHRIDFDESTWFGSPRWSPVANQIAMHLSDSGNSRYVVYDLASATIIGEAARPPYSPRAQGGCGGGEMWRTAWSGDGMHVLYSFGLGDTGANGVWAWNASTGEQGIMLAANAGTPTSGPDAAVMFSASGGDESYIFAGTSAGGLPRILTDGTSPAWHY